MSLLDGIVPIRYSRALLAPSLLLGALALPLGLPLLFDLPLPVSVLLGLGHEWAELYDRGLAPDHVVKGRYPPIGRTPRTFGA